MTIELLGVRVCAPKEEGRLAVRIRRRRRQVGVEVLQAVPAQLVSQLGVRRSARPQGMPGAEDVVQVAGLVQPRCPPRPAELVLSFEDGDAPAGAREERSAGERVDPAPDDDGVVRPAQERTAVHSISIRQPGTASPVMPTIVWAGCSAPAVTSSIARVIVSYSVGSVV